MQVSQFTVPIESYPRYKYTRTHAVPLIDRFSDLVTRCGLKDPYPKPQFKDVDIYVIEDGTKDFVTTSDLTKKYADKVKQFPSRPWQPEELSRRIESNKASIFIASYSEAQSDDQKALSINGDFILIFDSELKFETPELASYRIIMSVEKASLFEQICLLLERIVLREFRERLRVLTAFMDIDTPSVFVGIDSEIKKIMEPKPLTESRIKSDEISSDPASIMKKYYQTRKDIIEKRIRKYIKKDLMEITKQIMLVTDLPSVDELTICDAIHLSVPSGTPGSGEVQSIEDLMPSVRRHMEFSKMKQRVEELENRLTRLLKLIEENQESIEHLRGEMIGMFKRSKIPDRESPGYKFPILKEEVAKKLLGVNGVIGCGYRYTTLEVFFRDSLTDTEGSESKEHTMLLLTENGITNYKFQTEKEITYFNGRVGSLISNEHSRRASIGGFALKGTRKELCLLTARHFAGSGGGNVYLEQPNEERKHIGEFLAPITNLNAPPDIAAALILDNVRNHFQTQFKNSDGDFLPSSVVHFAENEIENLFGLPVHMWGATSTPGVGVITNPEVYIPGMKRLVKFEDIDYNPIARFANFGDSGAMICADDNDGEHVQVVSMLMGAPLDAVGENERQSYYGFRMIDGLVTLQEEHETEFELC
ncbi:hypothetical protein ACF0H5_014941 [Mactra antiquata]